MKRALSILLCLLLVITVFPASAFADDQSNRDQFIKNFINMAQKQVQAYEKFESIENGMSLSVNGSVQNLTVSIPDEAIDLKNVSGKGGLTLKIAPQGDHAYCGLDAAYMDKELAGEFFMDGNRIIVTRESIESIDNYYPLSEEVKETFSLTNLPEYLVLADEELSIDWSELSENQSNISKEMVLKAVEEFIRIIPQKCFSYSEGYYVCEFDGSLITLGQMLNNLKQNRESIAEACANCIPKLNGMSDEEYEAIKQEAKQGCLDTIDSLRISDLAQIADLGIKIDTFRIKAAEDVMILEIAIEGNYNDISFEKFTYNSTTKFRNGKISQEANLVLAMAELQGDSRIGLNLHSNSVINGTEFNQDMTLHTDMKIDDDLIRGDIFIASEGAVQKPVINVPVLNERNSVILDENVIFPDDQYGNPNEISVVLNGRPVNFEDARPIIVNNRVLVPLRAIAEELGCEVSWEPPKYVKISDAVKEFTLTIGSNQILYKSGATRTMDVVPTEINGRTYVPVRFISEELGMEVEWDEEFMTVFINYPNEV